MAVKELRKSDVMAHLLDALDQKQDIGHYGRLTFAMVARHFMSEEELVSYLQKDPDCDEREARSLYQQVQGKDYKDLQFPSDVYEHISEYYEQKSNS
jgi:DNA primase large subunit